MKIKNSFLLAGLLAVTTLTANAKKMEIVPMEGDASPIQVSNIATGKPAPDFTLPDADGKPVKLSKVSADANVLLIFYRGDWCPYCMDQLDSLNGVLPQLEAHSVKVIGISPDKQEAVKNTRRRIGQDYIFVSDVGSKVINAYGVKKKDDGLPHPATVLIRKGGDVAWFYINEDYKQRPTGEQILQLVKRLAADKVEAE